MPVQTKKRFIYRMFPVYHIKKISLKGSVVHPGFMIIELLVALSALIIFSLSVAYMQGLSAVRSYDARHYLEATLLAERTLEQLYENKNNIREKIDTYAITIEKKHPFENIPFTQAIVKVSWHNSKNKEQHVQIQGGWVA